MTGKKLDSETDKKINYQSYIQESTFYRNMGRIFQLPAVKCLLFLWIASSLTYLFLFTSLLGDSSSDDIAHLDRSGEKNDYPVQPTFNSFSGTVNLSKTLPEVWSCDTFNKEITEQKRSLQFAGKNKAKSTSYCLLMMESFPKCIGFVQNPDNESHLLPNPFLKYNDKLSFENNAVKYRSSHIYFVHIMKSSGTSIEGLLRKLTRRSAAPVTYEPILSYYCSSMLYFYQKTVKSPRTRYISLDKRSYGLHKMVPSPGYYITVLRNPVDRFVSMYYYIKQGRYPGLLEDQLFSDIFNSKDLEDFVESTKNKQIPFFDDHSIRMLHFDRYPDVFSTFSGGPDTYIQGTTEIIKINQSHYEEALRNLRNCAFVGLTEHFDESQQMLETLLGLESLKTVEMNVNKNYDKKGISEKIRALIEPRVVYDTKLYEEAKSIFKKQYNNYLKFYGK